VARTVTSTLRPCDSAPTASTWRSRLIDSGGIYAIEDGRQTGGTHRNIYGLQFSSNSKHLAFDAIDSGGVYVVEDGMLTGGTHYNVAYLQLSPDGNPLAFQAYDMGGTSVVDG
jgi:hypothetical protein